MTPISRAALAASLVASFAMLISACSTPGPKPPAPPQTLAEPGRHALTVSDANAGATVTLDASQLLVVRLPLEPTAGVEWIIGDPKPSLLLPVGPPKFERDPREAYVGGPGVVIWTFKPQAPGSTALNFELRRPRSTLPPTQTLGYGVVVK